MRRIMMAAVAALAVASSVRAADVAATSSIDSVVVYPDGASVVRTLKVDLPAGESAIVVRDLPLAADRGSLRVEGEALSRVEIGSVESSLPLPGEPPRPDEASLEKVRDELAAIDDRIAAASLRIQFLQSLAAGPLGKDSAPRPAADVKQASAAIGEEALLASHDLREARIARREPERRLAALTSGTAARPPERLEVRINVSARQPGQATMRLVYTVSGASWRPLYDASLTTAGKPALRLTRKAEVLQSSGEDWRDVALSVSTLRTSKGTEPGELQPLIARYRPQPRPVPLARANRIEGSAAFSTLADTAVSAVAPAAPMATPMQVAQASPEIAGLQVSYRIAGKSSVPSDKTARTFVMAETVASPEVVLRSTPEADEAVFVRAEWRQEGDAPLLPGQVSIHRDGTFVGRGAMPLTLKGETAKLGFGIDEKVKVRRALVRRGGATPGGGVRGFLASDKTEERTFSYRIHNGRGAAVKLVVEDRLPVAENDEIKVEALASPSVPVENDVGGRRGVRAWTFEVKAGGHLESEFGWRVSWPKERDAAVE